MKCTINLLRKILTTRRLWALYRERIHRNEENTLTRITKMSNNICSTLSSSSSAAIRMTNSLLNWCYSIDTWRLMKTLWKNCSPYRNWKTFRCTWIHSRMRKDWQPFDHPCFGHQTRSVNNRGENSNNQHGNFAETLQFEWVIKAPISTCIQIGTRSVDYIVLNT